MSLSVGKFRKMMLSFTDCKSDVTCATCEFSNCVPLAITKRLVDMIDELLDMVKQLTDSEDDMCDSWTCCASEQEYNEEINKLPDKDGYTGTIPGSCPMRIRISKAKLQSGNDENINMELPL